MKNAGSSRKNTILVYASVPHKEKPKTEQTIKIEIRTIPHRLYDKLAIVLFSGTLGIGHIILRLNSIFDVRTNDFASTGTGAVINNNVHPIF